MVRVMERQRQFEARCITPDDLADEPRILSLTEWVRKFGGDISLVDGRKYIHGSNGSAQLEVGLWLVCSSLVRLMVYTQAMFDQLYVHVESTDLTPVELISMESSDGREGTVLFRFRGVEMQARLDTAQGGLPNVVFGTLTACDPRWIQAFNEDTSLYEALQAAIDTAKLNNS